VSLSVKKAPNPLKRSRPKRKAKKVRVAALQAADPQRAVLAV
jgi:hypothetical protein